MSGGDPSNPIHLEGLRDSAIQQGIPLEDIEVGYATNQEVVDMWKEQSADFYVNNPLEKWKEDMQRADNDLMPRYAEDILDGMPNKLSVAKITLDRLQAKKDKRGERP